MVPAVLTGVNKDMKIFWEEQFGPIVPIVKYKDAQEVIDFMDQSDYAQQIALYGDKQTHEMTQLRDAAKRVYARTNINAPCMR